MKTSSNTLADRLKANNEAKVTERLNAYNEEKAACSMYLNYEGDKRRKEYKQLRNEVISWHKPFMNRLAKMLNLPTYEDCFCSEPVTVITPEPKKASGIIKLSNSRKAAIALVIVKHLDLAASKHEYNAIRYKDDTDNEGAKQDDCLELALRFLDCYDYHSSFPVNTIVSEVKTPEKTFKATIYNTDKKPNAVQAAILEIKDLLSIGFTKKEISYNFNGCNWNGYEFTSMNIVGTKIRDLNCHPDNLLLKAADLFIRDLDAKSEKALSKFEYLETYTNSSNRRMCDRSFLYLLDKIIECEGFRIAE